jgi:hypothetical protein
MTHTIAVFGYTFAFEPTLLQQRFAGRAMCVFVAVPLAMAAFTPLLLAAAKIL